MNNDYRREGESVWLYPYSSPPYLHTPGETLFFVLRGETDPDALAEFLTVRREKNYSGPV